MEKFQNKKFLIGTRSDVRTYIPKYQTSRTSVYGLWENSKQYITYTLYDESGKKWFYNRYNVDEVLIHGSIIEASGFIKSENCITRVKISDIKN